MTREWDINLPGWLVALNMFSSLSQSAIGRWGCVFHTVQGDIDAGNLGFCPRVVEVVDAWRAL